LDVNLEKNVGLTQKIISMIVGRGQ